MLEEDFFDYEQEEECLPSDDTQLYERHRIVVDKGQGLMRIDKFLTNMLGSVSRNRFQNAADAGFIKVNGKVVKSSYKVKPCDEIVVSLQTPPRDYTIIPEDIPLEIVYEDADVLLINKSPNMVVHPGLGNATGTLLNAIAWHLRDDPTFDANNPSVGLVHRIDKDTSGLILAAKNENAKAILAKQFRDKTTKRTYNAIVWGAMKNDSGTIEAHLARNPRNRMQFCVVSPEENPAAKHAITHYRVLKHFKYTTLVECNLETGRTHQIRVHLKHIGHTLFCDDRYEGCEILFGERTSKYKQFISNCFDICPRQALHAKTLGFTHPTTGQEMFFDTELPADLTSLIDKMERYQ